MIFAVYVISIIGIPEQGCWYLSMAQMCVPVCLGNNNFQKKFYIKIKMSQNIL